MLALLYSFVLWIWVHCLTKWAMVTLLATAAAFWWDQSSQPTNRPALLIVRIKSDHTANERVQNSAGCAWLGSMQKQPEWWMLRVSKKKPLTRKQQYRDDVSVTNHLGPVMKRAASFRLSRWSMAYGGCGWSFVSLWNLLPFLVRSVSAITRLFVERKNWCVQFGGRGERLYVWHCVNYFLTMVAVLCVDPQPRFFLGLTGS